MFDVTMRHLRAMFMVVVTCAAPPAYAAEGGSDSYLPGDYGDFGMAVLPQKGFSIESVLIYSPTAADLLPRAGVIQRNLEQTSFSATFDLSYVTDLEILGGRYFVGLCAPLERVDVDTEIDVGGFLGLTSAGASGLGDVTLTPIGIGWQTQSLSVAVYENINLPIGEFNAIRPVSLSLNYWAFDTNFALTWTDSKEKLEIDFNLGFTINTTNSATDYRSGNALHLDYTLGYAASESWSVALVGYLYDQVTGDSGSGARLGPFKGRAYGLGPALTHSFGQRTPVGLTAKWLHDLDTTNRLEGDYVYLVISVSL